MTNIEQLEEKERVLWAQVKELEAPYQAKSLEWCKVKQQIDREKLRAEIVAEQKGDK